MFSQTRNQKPQEDIELGLESFEKKDFSLSIKCLGRASAALGAEKMKLPSEMTLLIHYYHGAARFYREEYRLAETFLRKAKSISEILKSDTTSFIKVQALILLANCYEKLNEYLKQLEILQQLEPLLPKNDPCYGLTNLKIAELSIAKKDFKVAMEALIKSQDFYQRTADVKNQIHTQLEMGYCYQQQGEYKKAIEEYKKADEYCRNHFKSVEGNELLAQIEGHLGRCEYQIYDFKNSKNHLDFAHKQHTNPIEKLGAQFGLGLCLNALKESTLSKELIREVFDTYEKLTNPEDQRTAQIFMRSWQRTPLSPNMRDLLHSLDINSRTPR